MFSTDFAQFLYQFERLTEGIQPRHKFLSRLFLVWNQSFESMCGFTEWERGEQTPFKVWIDRPYWSPTEFCSH